jgi:hypothetical protein
VSGGVTPVRPAAPSGSAPAGAPGGTGTLVPAAAPLTLGGIDDALALLYVAMSKLRENGTAAGKDRVQSTEDAKQEQLKKEEAARHRQEANDSGPGFFQSIGKLVGDVAGDLASGHIDHVVDDGTKDVSTAINSPGFWHDLEQGALWVAKVAAVVGSTALTVATCGAAGATLALAGVALAAGGEIVSRTRMFGDASTAVALGLDIGGAVAGLGGTIATATGSVATTADKGLVTFGRAAESAGGAAMIVQGGAHIRTTNFEADAQQAAADATEAARAEARMQTLVQRVIDEMKSDDKERQKGLQTVQGAIEANDKATAAAVMPLTMRG